MEARFTRARSEPLLVTPDAGHPQKLVYKTGLPRHNDLLLGREHLLWLLHLLSREIEQSGWFRAPVRLAVHGGAQVVLSEAFRHLPGARGATRDIDYISHTRERATINAGYSDACLRKCMKRAAKASGIRELGAGWMNVTPDAALAGVKDPLGKAVLDQIWEDTMASPNVRINTLFATSHLVLVGVPWHWTVALKLARFAPHDARDIACVLRVVQPPRGIWGAHHAQAEWTPDALEWWLAHACLGMRYDLYPPPQRAQMRARMRSALALAREERARYERAWFTRRPRGAHASSGPVPQRRDGCVLGLEFMDAPWSYHV